MCDKCLVKMETALYLYNKIFGEREKDDNIHTTFITEYCFNYSTLLLVVFVNV